MNSLSKRWSIEARFRSVMFAWRGVRYMIASQHNAWIHLVATLTVVMLAVCMKVGAVEWCLLIVAIVAVWTAESMNTALECLCDVASPEFHPLIEKAKDVAAGSVLFSAIGAAGIGLIIFGPRLWSIWSA